MKAISLFSLAAAIVICASCKSKDANDIILQAESDARQIVSAAEVRANTIIEAAKNKAQKILEEADEEAERIKQETENNERYSNSLSNNSTSSSSVILSYDDLNQIIKEYELNAAAADIKYKGKRITVQLVDYSIDTAWLPGEFEITKEADFRHSYHFVTKESQKEVVASLNRSNTIMIAGYLSSGYGHNDGGYLRFNESVIVKIME